MFSVATWLCFRGGSLLLLYPKAFCGTESCQEREQECKEEHPLKMTINHVSLIVLVVTACFEYLVIMTMMISYDDGDLDGSAVSLS